jgi:GNAT superfamily N-acetyltransferase
MPSFWRMKYLQFREHAQEHGLLSALWFTLYKTEEVVPVEKDLSELKPLKEPKGGGLQLLDLGPENFAACGLDYPLESRRERAARYFRRGYRNIAMARDGKVVGDVWYVSPGTARTRRIHPHVRWFGLDLRDDEVYMFDMRVHSDERGGGLATYFMGSALRHLREKGVRKAYGYFAAKNTPALWVHRLLGWRERPRFALQRFFLYERVKAKASP